jgi:SAM-dependent methyltransferase
LSDWFEDLLAPGQSRPKGERTWRLHPQPDDQFFADYLPAAFLMQLDRDAALGWRAAVENALPLLPAAAAEYTRDYFLEPYRADFVERLGLQSSDAVADIGCGWGFASQRCLEKGCRVVGTDNAMRRLEFCRNRFEQQSFGDRFVGVELDVNRQLPFRRGSFRAVIVSGLMEWLPCTAAGRPDEIQASFLRQCFEILGPEGRAYVAIENRFWGWYFAGALDLHSRQPLVSILPRRLARALSMLMSGEDYRAHTYSILGYLRMFKRAGFRRLDILYPRPDYVQPKRIETLVEQLPLDAGWPDLLRHLIASCGGRLPLYIGRSFMFLLTK